MTSAVKGQELCDLLEKNVDLDTLITFINSLTFYERDYLFRHPIDVEMNTPLHLACRSCSLDTILYLLSLGICDLIAENERGDTPFQLYYYRNRFRTTETLDILYREMKCILEDVGLFNLWCHRSNKNSGRIRDILLKEGIE